jgi:hypothetical protein
VKKLIISLIILSTGFLSCKKDKAQPVVDTKTVTIENATVILAGNLAYSSETNSGIVKVYQQKDGKYLLALEKLNLKVNSPSFVIYLSSSEMVLPSSIKICSVGKLSVDILHSLPPDIDFTIFKYLVIQTEQSDEFIASAELN